ncbi:MAG: hypothetical protein AAFP90_08090, partial [Planctomycetota bacterium]
MTHQNQIINDHSATAPGPHPLYYPPPGFPGHGYAGEPTATPQHSGGIGWFDGLLRYPILALLIAGTIFSLAFVATYLSHRSYQSEGALYFRVGRENTTLDATASVGERIVLSSPGSREREMNSILAISKSRNMVERLVDSIGVDPLLSDQSNGGTPSDGNGLTVQIGIKAKLPPRERAIRHVQDRLSVSAVSDANIIRARYEGHSPEFAQQVIQAYLDAYQELHVSIHHNSGSQSFLEDQTKVAKQRLDNLEQQLSYVKKSLLMAAPDEQRVALVTRASKLQTDLMENEAVEASLARQIDVLKEMLNESPKTMVVSSTSGKNNEATDRMRDRLYQLQLQQQRLVSRKQNDHPEVIA